MKNIPVRLLLPAYLIIAAITTQGCQTEVNTQLQDTPSAHQTHPEPSSPKTTVSTSSDTDQNEVNTQLQDTPGINQADSESSSPKTTASTSSDTDQAEHLDLAHVPERDLYKIAARLKPRSKISSDGEIYQPEVNVEIKFDKIIATPPQANIGDSQIFPLFNNATNEKYNITAKLQYITPNAYWYFAQNTSMNLENLKETAKTFEEKILPTIITTFGNIWPLDATGNLRITILHAPLSGSIGYYTSINEHPLEVHESSIERKAIYLHSEDLKLGSDSYFTILSHELQHMSHWNQDPTEDSWVNEGLSELAADITGFPNKQTDRFALDPSTQLNAWNHNPGTSSYHYGASYLFFRYILDKYIKITDIKELIKESTDGILGIEKALGKLGHKTSFNEIFGRWTVANLISSDTINELGYNLTSKNTPRQNFKKITPQRLIKTFGTYPAKVPQYSADYIKIALDSYDISITFIGQTKTKIFPAELPIETHCWWGNQGDSIDSHLTKEIDLTSLANSATLGFDVWFDIEKDWDYAYVMVSEDDGISWNILSGLYSVENNPTGNSYGPGYTGKSTGWAYEQIDLSPYVGKKIFLRFEYITDEAYNSHGICIDNISIPEIGFIDSAESSNDWAAVGFIRTNNAVPQEYIVQIVEITLSGEAKIRQISLDTYNNATISIKDTGNIKELYVLVSPINPTSREMSDYTLRVNQGAR